MLVKSGGSFALSFIIYLFSAGLLFAGGPWIPDRGHGYFSFGFDQKRADSIFDINGSVYHLPSTSAFQRHDFRYYYATGELGLSRNLSFNFVITFLDGLEGPEGHLERNSGFSDAWFGLKYGFMQQTLPMAVSITLRTPVFYDIEGPYSRRLFDDEGNYIGHSPEWRGLLKHDLTVSYLLGRSLQQGEGWLTGEIGYTWREGAPADQIPVTAEVGYRLSWFNLQFKSSALFVFSLGNDSERQPDDRFGYRPGSVQNFNDASRGQLFVSLIIPTDSKGKWNIEPGYGRCVWGRSARRYNEWYLSLWHRF